MLKTWSVRYGTYRRQKKYNLTQIKEKNFYIKSIAPNNCNPTKIVYLLYWLNGHFSNIFISYFIGSNVLWYLTLNDVSTNYSKL